jgi:cytidylate kinase
MVALQQAAARQLGGVLEGRDIGTCVFPDTPHKFFLSARIDVRGRRRFEELAATGRALTYEQVLDDLARRDERDRTRKDSPLSYDDSYTLIDTSDLTIDEVVEKMAKIVAEKSAP